MRELEAKLPKPVLKDHGGYPAAMELYGLRDGFSMSGQAGTDRIPTYQRQLAFYTYRAMVTVALLLAAVAGTPAAGLPLADAALRFRSSLEYVEEPSAST